jgi:serine/threonine-protein kinase
MSYTKTTVGAQAKTLGFKLEFTEQFSETQPKDKIIGQKPAPGERILSGGTITLTVSRGPEIYPVPDIVGKSFDLATQDLQSLRLVVTKTDQYSDTIPTGSVVDTNPKVGTNIRPGDKITVVVSKGPNPIKVPNVVGKNVDEAKNELNKVGITNDRVQTTDVDSDKPAGQVVQQDVSDVSVQPDTVVKLQISKGPPLVTVPDLTDHQVDEAKATLEGLGLVVQVFGFGTVRNQNPPGNSQVPPGSTVSLIAAF